MKRKLLLLIALATGLKMVHAQGVWVNQNPTTFNYNFERTEANPGNGLTELASGIDRVQSVSTKGGPAGLLPFPSSGYSKINFPENSNASATFDGTDADSKLVYKIASSNGSSAPYTGYSKFSLYENTETSAVTSIFFTLKPNATTASGRLFLVFGNTPDGTADNSNVYNGGEFLEYWTNGQSIFGGLKFDLYSGDYAAWGYRKSGITDYGFQEVAYDGDFNSQTGTPLTKNFDNTFEIYCNNYSAPADYERNSTTYTVASGSYHIWVNGSQKAIINAGVPNYNFPAASGESTANTAINSIGIFGDQNSGDLNVSVSKIEMAYVATSTLPVTFTSFTGLKKGTGVQLNFSISSEQNNSHFEILRSADGVDFETIGRVEGNGIASKYSFYDTNPLAGENYYQLKQVDKDEKWTIFNKTVAINADIIEKNLVITEITDSKLGISIFAAKAEQAILKIADVSGRTLVNNRINLEKGYNIKDIAVSGLKGIYVLTIVSDSFNQSIKFSK
ncbi:T9SS type A sorting domain-containing protein [Pseudopedobacter beijingensis]|uniref:T9SS type A sorting domain-containing protein n=1 Tax=Pseudopedobacter beijingensis TaxID=1207056 RepID=A0ABW4IIT5_9SPHI